MFGRSGRAAALSALVLVLAGGLLTGAEPSASANEPLPDGPATLQEFVRKSVPQWNFARANRNDPCWPQSPFNADGTPFAGGKLQNWPNSDGGCERHGMPFPTYYTVQKCGTADDEIRVTFTIYLATSAFRPSGHSHDFEHIDVVWKRTGTSWSRDRLLMGFHSGHNVQTWVKAESWNADRGSAGLGREFPRIFVGWGSHAMFNNQGGLKDALSQYTKNEYRHADYPVWADGGGGLVEVTPGGDLYRTFEQNASAWGSATSNPAQAARTSCLH